MDTTLKVQYTATARFDYIKLRFKTLHPGLVEEVKMRVWEEWTKLAASAGVKALKDPKFTPIDPSPNKPNGLFIVELFGFAAESVKGLPAGWLQYVTFAHVKSFAHGMRLAHIVELRDKYMSRQARRSVSVINGGTGGRSKKGVAMPAIRIGSRKSDWHGIIYARKGFAPGFEGRYRDEGVYQRTLKALDLWNNGEFPDGFAWGAFLRDMAGDTAACFETDAMQRDISLEHYIDSFGGYGTQDFDQMAMDIVDEEPIDLPSQYEFGKEE